jgi:phospholipid/cholesterol/gamma-HCH transport system substrate-binding protein
MLVGAVFFSGLVLIGVFTIVIKDITVFEGKQNRLAIIFDRVAGLERGHKVLASGMEVGRVGDLELQENGAVKVNLDLTKPVQLFKDYKIAVRDQSALGGKYVDIQVGTQELGVVPLAEARLEPLDGRAQDSIFDDPNLRETFISVRKIAKDIEEGRGTVGLLITQRELYDNIKATSEDLKAITAQIRNTQGTIGKLLYEAELYNKLDRVLGNVENISTQIRSGEGTVGKLIYDDKLYTELQTTLASTRKVMNNVGAITDKIKRGEGTVGKLIYDDKLHQQVELAVGDARSMMQEIQKAVRQINEGKGTMATLFRDEKLAKDLKDTVADIKVVAERLKKGEGTVGKLLADETIYKELQRLLKNFSDSLEDTREQVPISAFTSILFKAF